MMKNIGTKKIARTVAEIMPPTTARPIAFCPPAPAPLAIASGNTPNTKARLVIRMGRSRSFAASTAASNGVSRLVRIVGTHWARYLIMGNMVADADKGTTQEQTSDLRKAA